MADIYNIGFYGTSFYDGPNTVASERLTSWSFSFDGHTFYVLNTSLGSLLYDIFTDQWSWWGSVDSVFLTSKEGACWRDLILLGSDEGTVLKMDSELYEDHDGKIVTWLSGYVPSRGTTYIECFAAHLIGYPTDIADAAVSLYISDDKGATFWGAGALDKPGPEVSWRSLGQIVPPFRVFAITDNGAYASISSLDMDEP